MFSFPFYHRPYLVRRFFPILVFGLFSLFSFGQKEVAGTIDASGIRSIVISSDEIYRIKLTTAAVEEISYVALSEGEYYNQISLESRIEGETLYLSSQFREILQSGYDKLSAHKVFSMEVELEIPEGLSVVLTSNLTSVYASGKYDNVLFQLTSGSCYLKNFEGDAIVNTFTGNIEVETENAEVTANSRHGKVILPSELSGSHTIKLSSINGNIVVKRTE